MRALRKLGRMPTVMLGVCGAPFIEGNSKRQRRQGYSIHYSPEFDDGVLSTLEQE